MLRIEEVRIVNGETREAHRGLRASFGRSPAVLYTHEACNVDQIKARIETVPAEEWDPEGGELRPCGHCMAEAPPS